MSPCLLGAVLGYFMRKFPAASRTFAWPFTRLPDENPFGHGRDSSTDLLQMDETEGDMVNCRHGQLSSFLLGNVACLHYQQVYSRPQAIGPELPYDVFISSGLWALYRSLSRDSVRGNRYPRLCPRSQDYEGISFALPGMGTQSRLPMI